MEKQRKRKTAQCIKVVNKSLLYQVVAVPEISPCALRLRISILLLRAFFCRDANARYP